MSLSAQRIEGLLVSCNLDESKRLSAVGNGVRPDLISILIWRADNLLLLGAVELSKDDAKVLGEFLINAANVTS